MRVSQQVGAFEAKTKLSRYIADAQRGIITVVTVRGKPAAKIVPANAEVVERPFDAGKQIRRAREIRARSRPGPETTHDLINAGRR